MDGGPDHPTARLDAAIPADDDTGADHDTAEVSADPGEGHPGQPVQHAGHRPRWTRKLSSSEVSSWSVLGMQNADPAAIHNANQFNDEAGPGQVWVQLTVTASIAANVTEPVSPYSLTPTVVGDKGKVYEAKRVSDMDGVLGLLDDQPEAIGGGSMSGQVPYLVDADDADFLVLMNKHVLSPTPETRQGTT